MRFNNNSHKWHKGTAAQTRQTFALLARVTNPQTTEDGETWLKDTSIPTAKTTILVQQVTQAHPQIGMDTGECKNAQLAEKKVTTQENCRAKWNNEFWCTRCNRNNHCNNTCRLAPRRSSTPKYTGNYHPHPSPRTGDDHTVPPVEPHFTTRPSPMIASQGTGNLELSQMLQTILRENNEEAKLKQQQKEPHGQHPHLRQKGQESMPHVG